MRATWITAAAFLALGHGCYAVAEPGRVTYAAETSPGGPTRLAQMPGNEAVLVTYANAAWLWQPSQLRVLRHYPDPDVFETVTIDHLHTSRPVQMIKTKDGTFTTLRDVMTDADIAKIGADETLLMLADAFAGDLIITRQGGEWDTQRNAPSDGRLLLRKGRTEQPFVSLLLPLQGAKSTTVSTALSANGKALGVTANGRAWLIDLINGTVRAVTLADPTIRLENLAFLPDGKRIVFGVEAAGFVIVEAASLKVVKTLKAPRMARKMRMVARAGGRVVEVEGRRERVVVDVTTGQFIQAQRISSGHAYQMDWVDRDLVIRASRPRLSKTTTYGAYRHVEGAFKPLYRTEQKKLTLAGVAASPNGACLYLGGPQSTTIHDLARDKPILTITGLKDPLEEALFTRGGTHIFGIDAKGRAARIETPRPCHGKGSL